MPITIYEIKPWPTFVGHDKMGNVFHRKHSGTTGWHVSYQHWNAKTQMTEIFNDLFESIFLPYLLKPETEVKRTSINVYIQTAARLVGNLLLHHSTSSFGVEFAQ